MKKQSGSAHVIIIVALLLALVGALGYIFWQSFSKNEQTSDTKTSTKLKDKEESTNTDKVTQTVPNGYVAYNNETIGFSLAYPKEWGDLKAAGTRPNSNRLGANGVSTEALADANGVVRIEAYTKDSFSAKMASGYVTKYQGSKVVGSDAGSSTYEVLKPITGTNVYAYVYGDAGFISYDLFFEAGDSVVYVTIGDSKATQSQVATTVKVD